MLLTSALSTALVLSLSVVTSNGSYYSNDIAQTSALTLFEPLLSIDGFEACAVLTTPYNEYTADTIGGCSYFCQYLHRYTSNSTRSCAGFNYRESNHTCQLFTTDQNLYFVEQSRCRYFMNFEVAGTNFNHWTVCPPSFVYNSQAHGCYKMVKSLLNWNAAASNCQASVPGGHLVFINSSQEFGAVSQLIIASGGCKNTWTGAQLLNVTAFQPLFYWMINSTTPLAPLSYSNWSRGQPSGDGPCMEMLKNNNYTWNDVRCTRNSCSVCEIDL